MMAVPLALFACGDDDDDDAADTTTAAADTTTAAVSTTVAGTAGGSCGDRDHGDGDGLQVTGLSSRTAGRQLAPSCSTSSKEVHEMVVIRIPDTDNQTVGEILALPEEELLALAGDDPPPLVMVALPGEQGEPVSVTARSTSPVATP